METSQHDCNCINKAECKACQALYDEINANQNRRLDNIEDELKEIRKLNMTVAEMAQTLKQMANELSRQGDRLEVIEKEPAKNWKNAIWLIIAGIIGAVLTIFLRKLGV